MENLPILVLTKILSHLSIKEQLICSGVCKRWRIIILNLSRDQLIFHFDKFPNGKKWSSTSEIMKYRNSFEIKRINFLRNNLTRTYFKRTKQLSLFNSWSLKDCIGIENLSKHLYYFKDLEILEIDGFNLVQKTNLNLKNLKILSLKNVYIEKQLELNLPKLEQLICCANLDLIIFRHPESIRRIQFFNHGRECKLKDKFVNLTHLDVYDINGYLLKGFLSKLPKLKQLNLYSQMTEDDFKELKRQKEMVFDLNDLKIFHFGFDHSMGYIKNCFLHYLYNNMLNRDKLEDITADHLDKLVDHSPWPIFIHYTDLIQTFKQDIPRIFFSKFDNFYKVHVRDLDLTDQNNCSTLTNFLTKCGFLESLAFQRCSIDQTFFDHLHLVSSFSVLELIEQFNLKTFDFNFIQNLNLHCITVRECKIPDQLLNYSFKSSRFKFIFFEDPFEFKLNFSISLDKNRFCLSRYLLKDKKFSQLDHLVKYLKKNEQTRIHFF